VVKGRLTAEQVALLMRAIEAASDSLYREKSVSAETSSGLACDAAVVGVRHDSHGYPCSM